MPRKTFTGKLLLPAGELVITTAGSALKGERSHFRIRFTDWKCHTQLLKVANFQWFTSENPSYKLTKRYSVRTPLGQIRQSFYPPTAILRYRRSFARRASPRGRRFRPRGRPGEAVRRWCSLAPIASNSVGWCGMTHVVHGSKRRQKAQKAPKMVSMWNDPIPRLKKAPKHSKGLVSVLCASPRTCLSAPPPKRIPRVSMTLKEWKNEVITPLFWVRVSMTLKEWNNCTTHKYFRS